jgi:maleylacetoacetate isomerase
MVSLTQSMTVLEYLEETCPKKPSLLPPFSDPVGRATVRALANIISCDTQPVTNLRILSHVGGLGGVKEDWARELMSGGLAAYERLAATTSRCFSTGIASP